MREGSANLAQARVIASALDAFAPDLFIADRHAFGVDSELKPALTQLRELHIRGMFMSPALTIAIRKLPQLQYFTAGDGA